MSLEGDGGVDGKRKPDAGKAGGVEFARGTERVTDTQPFVLRFTQQDRPAFDSLANKISLISIVGSGWPSAERYERLGGILTDSERRIIDASAINIEEQQRLGRDLTQMDDLEFRWVTADESTNVNQLIENAFEYGGARDSSSWVHVGNDTEEFMRRPAHERKPGVLFVYDGSKLRSLTDEEKEADWENPEGQHTHTQARKALSGLELKDTLVGMVGFANAQETEA